jgi:hypothetical protein
LLFVLLLAGFAVGRSRVLPPLAQAMMQHPGHGGVAGDGLGGGRAEGRAVLQVAAPRVRWVARWPVIAPRFRGNAELAGLGPTGLRFRTNAGLRRGSIRMFRSCV